MTYNFSHIVLSVCITAYPMQGPVDTRCPGNDEQCVLVLVSNEKSDKSTIMLCTLWLSIVVIAGHYNDGNWEPYDILRTTDWIIEWVIKTFYLSNNLYWYHWKYLLYKCSKSFGCNDITKVKQIILFEEGFICSMLRTRPCKSNKFT